MSYKMFYAMGLPLNVVCDGITKYITNNSFMRSGRGIIPPPLRNFLYKFSQTPLLSPK
jgi:hypothetical protein